MRTAYLGDHTRALGVDVSYAPSDELPADGLTKVLSKTKLCRAQGYLGLIPGCSKQQF